MTLRNGNTTGNNGGSILNAGALTLDNVTITGSRARYGGAVYASGTLSLSDTVIAESSACWSGVYLSKATANLTNVTMRVNTVRESGGAIFSAVTNLDARQNWWGVASGPTSVTINNNVQFAPFLTDSCPN